MGDSPKKSTNPLILFLVGVVMFGVGAFLFSKNVTVTNTWGMGHIGGARINGGLVVLPMIIGVVWWFISPKSIPAKILTGLGFIFIVVSVIMSTRLVMKNLDLYEYILILVLMAGGAGLVLKTLFGNNKDDKKE